MSSPDKRGKTFRFFRFLWRSLKAFNTVVFGLLALMLLSILFIAAVEHRTPPVSSGSALVINPSGTLVEQRTVVGAAAVLPLSDLPQQALVKDIIDALSMAKDDPEIALVVLDLDKLQQGLMPKLERIADAIDDFKASGKQVVAVADNYSQPALYLAAHADEVLMNPEGVAAIEGFAINGLYFKTLLDDNDISINVFRTGDYKSAAEPFIRNDMSPEAKEAWLAILDAWWDAYTRDIETARDLSPGSINNLMQNLPEQLRSAQGNLARLALDAGLVDRLMTDTEQRSYLIELTGKNTDTHDYRRVSYNHYLRTTRHPAKHEADKIAIITAVGNIVDGKAPAGTIGSDSLTQLIRKARLDDNVKAIVLRIDSGGGSKSASEKIRSELQAAQDAGIPLVASMGSVAGSGGYWIAASADEIWASPTTITGSIGVIGLIPGLEKALERYGISSDGLATTPVAGASMLRDLPPELNDVIQLSIDAAYQQFLSTVAEGRNMDIDAVHKIGQGRIWIGETALQLGLVDELGDLEQAILAAAGRADIDDYTLWYVEPELSIEDMLLQRLLARVSGVLPQASDNPLHQIVGTVRQELGFLQQLNDPRSIYVICTDCPSVQ